MLLLSPDSNSPKIEDLKKEKTPEEIIESALRPDGGDLKKDGLFEKLELRWKKYGN